MKIVYPAFFVLFLLVGCGGGSDSKSGAGSGGNTSTNTSANTSASASSSNSAGCTGAQIAGQWRISVTANGITETDTITFDGSEAVGSNQFSANEDGISLQGQINDACNMASGTASDSATGLSGTWTATKL